jgi:aminoglycoside phosphotransferase (APT) family kinase protein
MGLLDIEDFPSLLEYLSRTGRIGRSEQAGFRKLEGGVSNRTVLVERPSGEAWVLKQALEKLRVPVDWFSPPERIEREAAGLRWLARIAEPGSVTALLFEDPHEHLLAMEAVPQPHDNWKTVLLGGAIDLAHFRSFGRLLGSIHREGYLRRDELRPVFEDRSFFESLRLEPYYSYTAGQAPRASEFLNALIADTLASRLSLVHGDYSPKNVLIHNGRMVLLDHEVIHFGDPAFDLGFSLTHFLSKAHHLPRLRRAFAGAADEYWRAYTESLGTLPWAPELEPRAVRHTLACLLARVAGRSQLEYLDGRERERQRGLVLEMMTEAPGTVHGLITEFTDRLEACRQLNA